MALKPRSSQPVSEPFTNQNIGPLHRVLLFYSPYIPGNWLSELVQEWNR